MSLPAVSHRSRTLAEKTPDLLIQVRERELPNFPLASAQLMAFSSVELWQRIAAEGLASPMQCRSWAAEAAESMEAADTADGLKVLQALIASGRLTNYQAKILAGQSDKPLHRGPWTILGNVKFPLWSSWQLVAKVDLTKAGSPPATWARWLSSANLQALKTSAPSLPRGLQLASVQHPHLQSVLVPELVNGELQLQVAPVSGSLLTEAFHKQTPTSATATVIVKQIASALAAMHAANLVHGRVLPDRMSIDVASDPPACCLLRDPISLWTATLDESAVGILGEKLGELKSAQFLAPEFVAPGQLPTMASDVYALGCTWWWLLTGVPPATGQTTQQILARQTTASSRLPDNGNYPEPLARCLEHCLAKNLDARFPSAVAVVEALVEAERVVATGKTVKPKPAPKIEQPLEQSKTSAAIEPKPAPPKPAPPNADEPQLVTALTKTKTKTKTETEAEAQPQPQPQPQPRTQPKTQPQPKTAVTATVAKSSQANPNQEKAKQEERTATKPSVLVVASEAVEAAPVTNTNTIQPQPAKSLSKPSPVRRKKKRGNKWLMPVVSGCGFMIVVLVILKLSGALQPGKPPEQETARGGYIPPSTNDVGQVIERDPRLDYYTIVDDDDTIMGASRSACAIDLDLLPPGGQMFLSIRPSSLLSGERQKTLLAAFNDLASPLLQVVAKRAGQPLESLKQVTVGFYSAKSSGALPEVVYRVEMLQPTPLGTLKAGWGNPAKAKVGEQELLATDDDWAYYVMEQPLIDSQSISVFSVGPAVLMREVAEMGGAAGPLTSQMQSMREASNRNADISIVASPRYLFSEGRGLLAAGPARLQNELKSLLGSDTRAALLQTQLDPSWYVEVQIVGASDREAPGLIADMHTKITDLPTTVENWFVEESPHSYWRGLALRYPQMLRAFSSHARYGVEDGTAIMNAYLAPEAAPNLMLASWIALQDGATMASNQAGAVAAVPEAKPLTIEEYLGRAIKLTFDQEPIEVALSLIGEEANAGLPAGTPKLRFALDGDAFEKSGITRNQQLRDFKVDGGSVRDALTDVAKRGNPEPADLKSDDQKLIWVVMDDPTATGQKMISLTTRPIADAANIPIPPEFLAE
ncbi:MAG: serine/threonine-protein kinase [Pirellulaceae bacterium]